METTVRKMRTEEDRPQGFAPLLGNIVGDMQTLLHQELVLARTELTAELADAKTALLRSIAAGALMYAGALCALTAVLAGLVQIGVDLWVASLGLGVVLAVSGILLYRGGKSVLSLETKKETPHESAV